MTHLIFIFNLLTNIHFLISIAFDLCSLHKHITITKIVSESLRSLLNQGGAQLQNNGSGFNSPPAYANSLSAPSPPQGLPAQGMQMGHFSNNPQSMVNQRQHPHAQGGPGFMAGPNARFQQQPQPPQMQQQQQQQHPSCQQQRVVQHPNNLVGPQNLRPMPSGVSKI